jgi:hypothetical protein
VTRSRIRAANTLFRGLLEFVGLVALSFGAWGLLAGAGRLRVVAAVGLPLLAAAAWATFRVAGDDWDTEAVGASGRGDPAVAVPGPVRLGLELLLFGGAVALLVLGGQVPAGVLLGGATVVHYAIDYERVRWLLGESPA